MHTLIHIIDQDGATQTLSRAHNGAGLPVYWLCIQAPGGAIPGTIVDGLPILGRVPAAKLAQVVDELDEMCNEGVATLVSMDEEWYVGFRNGRA
jgi:hypothetical protein